MHSYKLSVVDTDTNLQLMFEEGQKVPVSEPMSVNDDVRKLFVTLDGSLDGSQKGKELQLQTVSGLISESDKLRNKAIRFRASVKTAGFKSDQILTPGVEWVTWR